MTGTKIKVASLEVLFAWLWGWDGDGNNGDWPRKHWEFKAYRVLYRQCFALITQVYGLRQAQAWRTILKQTFIQTQFILPYPSTQAFWSRGVGNKLQTWASVHPGLMEYYRSQQPQGRWVIQTTEVEQLPLQGWERATYPCSLDV
ncbi:hypothetical protein IFM53868_10730 [Aspergillus udagawae]|uniref:Uncharacterized protein n=1 Tax=Aspergillus udagawae TaxID=91492 RepID=A0ABQ1BEY0_9EURO|nr:hypothetical protein IFM53868_10730 [Aspergillus udagawae]